MSSGKNVFRALFNLYSVMSTSMSICAYWTSACTPLSVLPVATKLTLLSLLTFVAASSMQDCIVLLFGCF